MRKQLFLVRHAQAVSPSVAEKDFERILNSVGVLEASKMGERLAHRQVKPAQIVASPALRSATTAQLLAERMHYETDRIQYEENLYEASVRSLLGVINELPDSLDSVMLVGHNPSFTYLAEFITQAEIGSLPTCAVACIELDIASWKEVSGQTGKLAWLEQPNGGRE